METGLIFPDFLVCYIKKQEVTVMRKNICNVLKKMGNKNWTMVALNALAILTVFQNVNSGCMWLDHQPEVPEEAMAFKRF